MYKQYYKDICDKTGGEPSIYWDAIFSDNDNWQAITGDYDTKVKWIYCRFYKSIYVPVKGMIDCRNGEYSLDAKVPFEHIALICCVLLLQGCDALGGFVIGKGYKAGKGNDKQAFNQYCQQYLLKDAKTKDINKCTLAGKLYTGFRNSLAHGLFVRDGTLAAPNEDYLAWKEGNRIVISLEKLLEVFKTSKDRYFADLLEQNSEKKTNFEKAFKTYMEHIEAKA